MHAWWWRSVLSIAFQYELWTCSSYRMLTLLFCQRPQYMCQLSTHTILISTVQYSNLTKHRGTKQNTESWAHAQATPHRKDPILDQSRQLCASFIRYWCNYLAQSYLAQTLPNAQLNAVPLPDAWNLCAQSSKTCRKCTFFQTYFRSML